MAVLDRTPWAFETSEEFSTSILLFAGGEGKIFLSNDDTAEKLVLRYTFFSVGVAKGAVFNIAESLKSDPSGGFTNARVIRGNGFGKNSFPCMGWMVVGALTAGIFQPSFMSQSGVDAAIALFGGIPFACLPMWGRFNSILPSGGTSAAVCKFEVSS